MNDQVFEQHCKACMTNVNHHGHLRMIKGVEIAGYGSGSDILYIIMNER